MDSISFLVSTLGFKVRCALTLAHAKTTLLFPAEVVELVDALASGASGRKLVGVRVPPSALLSGTCGWAYGQAAFLLPIAVPRPGSRTVECVRATRPCQSSSATLRSTL